MPISKDLVNLSNTRRKIPRPYRDILDVECRQEVFLKLENQFRYLSLFL